MAGHCRGCRGAQEKAAAGRRTPKRTRGVLSYIRAKLSGRVDEPTRLRRLAVCRMCLEQEGEIARGSPLEPWHGHPARDHGQDAHATRLYREIGSTPYCGRPRGLIESRDDWRDGCGCNLSDKTRWTAAACPRGSWGPGKQFAAWIQAVTSLRLPTLPGVIDVVQGTAGMSPDMTGIGDHLASLPIVHAIAHAWPEQRVRFVVQHAGMVSWAKLGWPDIVSLEALEATGERAIHTPERMVAGELLCERRQMDRVTSWATSLGYESHLQPIRLTVPAAQTLWASQELAEPLLEDRPIVALAPFANAPSRTWPLHHWLELTERLQAEGCYVIILDGADAARTEQFPAMRYWGYDGPHTAALLQHSVLYIGNDSGLTHLAGLLGVASLAICAPTRGAQVFGFYPSVETIQSRSICSGCLWQADRGHRNACRAACQAMWDVLPGLVAEAARKRLGRTPAVSIGVEETHCGGDCCGRHQTIARE